MTFLAFDTSPLDYFCIPKHGDNFFFFSPPDAVQIRFALWSNQSQDSLSPMPFWLKIDDRRKDN